MLIANFSVGECWVHAQCEDVNICGTMVNMTQLGASRSHGKLWCCHLAAKNNIIISQMPTTELVRSDVKYI